eukprot:gene18430-37355_t
MARASSRSAGRPRRQSPAGSTRAASAAPPWPQWS